MTGDIEETLMHERSCQRQTQVLDLAVADMIAAVPRPSALSRTMRHRQTCFCGEEGCEITASSRVRSLAETVKNIPVRIPLNRIGQSKWESQIGLLCSAHSTSVMAIWEVRLARLELTPRASG